MRRAERDSTECDLVTCGWVERGWGTGDLLERAFF